MKRKQATASDSPDDEPSWVSLSDLPLIGKLSQCLNLGLGQAPVTSVELQLSPAETKTVDLIAGKTVWFEVEKSYGPVHIEKVGLAVKDSELDVQIDASIEVSGLTIDLEGLSTTIEVPPSGKPSFDLEGIGILFTGDDVEISGSFLLVPGGDLDFAGEAEIHAATFTLSALGSYDATGSDPSMFIFAMLEVPLGGPPFFFVTGVAAGFGFNRDLRIPTLDELPEFPLVQAVAGDNPFKSDDPAAALDVLQKYIPPQVGEDWLAVGLRFTSFELIQSFALATVSFGNHEEVALLGLASVSVPPNLSADQDPIGFAEMAIEVVVDPEQGVLEVAAQLTPGSYILSDDCHLTGGFAFYTWFSGDHAGDFVVTIGGYNPCFTPPDYYPKEPRVGFNWRVDDDLDFKGDMYFALTPIAVMAGGGLQATWESDPIKAWFHADADFFLSWKPFHYEADVGIELGASFSIHIWFVHITITIHIGLDLALWGPSFGGKVKVDLDIISFTISFGSDETKAQPISWDEFKQSFLPPVSSGATEATANGSITTDSYCLSRVSAGLIKEPKKDDPNSYYDWVLAREDFEIVTHTAIPAKTAQTITGDGVQDKTVPIPVTWATAIGVGPMNLASDDFTSEHTVTIHKMEGDKADDSYDFFEYTTVTPVTGNAPQATWNPEVTWEDNGGFNPGAQYAKSTGPAKTTISDCFAGLRIQPQVKPPDHTSWVDVQPLLVETHSGPGFAWTAPALPTSDPWQSLSDPQKLQKLESTITDPTVAANRQDILKVLAGGLQVATSVNVSGLAQSAEDVLQHAPDLRYLGEQPADGQR